MKRKKFLALAMAALTVGSLNAAPVQASATSESDAFMGLQEEGHGQEETTVTDGNALPVENPAPVGNTLTTGTDYDVWWDFEDGVIWEEVKAGKSISGSYDSTMTHSLQTESNNNKYMLAEGNKSGAWRASMYKLSDAEVSGAEVVFDWMPVSTDNDTRYGDIMFFSSADDYSYFNLTFNKNLEIFYYNTPGVNYREDLFSGIDFEGNVSKGSNEDRVAALKGTGLTGDGSTWFAVKVKFDYINHLADLTITNKSDTSKTFSAQVQIRSAAVNLNRMLLTAFKSLPKMGIDNVGIRYLTEVDPASYYDYWNDFETSEQIWESVGVGQEVIAQGGNLGATLTYKTEESGNGYMDIESAESGKYRVSKLKLEGDPIEKAEVIFDWKPISIQDNDTRFGDVAFMSSGSTYPYFGLQFDKNKAIKYYTAGGNLNSNYEQTYSEEPLEGGFKRDDTLGAGNAAATGITADGNTWYTVAVVFDYGAHMAELSISSRDDKETVLFEQKDIPIYASVSDMDAVIAGCWKAAADMGLDNLGIKYHYAKSGDIVSLAQPENVMVTAAQWEEHVSGRPVKAAATMGDGSKRELEIGVWTSSPAFAADNYTTYTWSAPLVLPEGVRNPKNLSLTYKVNYVKNYVAQGAYDPTTLEIPFGSVATIEEFEALRPTQTQAVLKNGQVVRMKLDTDSWTAVKNTLPTSWLPDEENHPTPETAPEFDPEKEGIYIYKVKLAREQEYVVEEDIWVEWRVNYFSYENNYNGYERTMEKLDRGLYAIRNVVYDSAAGTYVDSAEGGIYLSWRISADEYALAGKGQDITFDIYRNGEKIHSAVNFTNYLDKEGAVGDIYVVKASQSGIETSSKEIEALEENYISISLQRPLPSYSHTDNLGVYRLNDTEVADVDGDNEYEVIVKWYPNNGFDPGVNGTNRSSSPHIIDVYEMDGTALWRLYMGYSSPAGQHFDNFMVYDLDQDGKAELSILTQDGSRTYRPDENGKFVYMTTQQGGYVFKPDDPNGSESAGSYVLSEDGTGYLLSNQNGNDFIYVGDYGSPMMDDRYLIDEVGDRSREGIGINSSGYKTVEAEEYFTVFNGETGEIIDTVDYYYSTEYFMTQTNNTNPHTVHRFNIAIATIPADLGDADCTQTLPAVVCNRAYYSDVSMIAYTLVNGKVKTAWSTYIPNESDGGGNHNMATGDMDNDGFDEIYLGAVAFDHDGSVLWAKNGFDNMDFMKHGDSIHLTSVFPDSNQLYAFTPVEDGSVSVITNYALSNGATGARVVAHTFGKGDTGRGMLANITPNPGYELWASNPSSDARGRLTSALYNAYGDVVSDKRPAVQTWASYWDGDLLSELPDSNPAGGGDKSGLPMGVHKYNWETGKTENIASFPGTLTNNSTKNNPNLIADILGDWREEILVRSTDNEELRIYMTNIPTEYTVYTLMHDPVYRNSVANQNTTYNQPTHVGFYLGEDIAKEVLAMQLPTPNIVYANASGEGEPKEIASVSKPDDVVVTTEEAKDCKHPEKAAAVLEDGTALEVTIDAKTWRAEPAFDAATEGSYVWTADITAPEGCTNVRKLTVSYTMTVKAAVLDKFEDLVEGEWYVSAVQYVYNHGYMNGKSGNTFDPQQNLARGEFATVLYSMAGKPAAAYKDNFPDVKEGDWYTSPVMWAYENEIVRGYDTGYFGTFDNISREQIALMLYKYAKLQGYDLSITEDAMNDFTDYEMVSEWAADAVNWAVSRGIMSGKPNGDGTYSLAPLENARRCECAAMIRSMMIKGN